MFSFKNSKQDVKKAFTIMKNYRVNTKKTFQINLA